MPSKEEPYSYLQRSVGSIVEDLTNELNDNLARFRNIGNEAYEKEENILTSIRECVKVSREIEREIKRQKEVEEVLDYLESEIDRLRETVKSQGVERFEGPSYGVIGDIDSLINEFNSLVANIDVEIPSKMNVLLNENMNMISYADSQIKKIVAKHREGAEEKPE
jgi:hypothetical protein